MEVVIALSLEGRVASGLTFFTGSVVDECSEPDDFLSDVVFTTPALAPPVLSSTAVSSSWLLGWIDVDSDAEPDGVVLVAPATEPDGVVLVAPATDPDGVAVVAPATDPDGVVLVAPATEPDGVEVVAPATDPDGVVLVAPATEPEGVEVVPDVVEVFESGAAHATPGDSEIADPIPRATANAPTRPT